MLRNVGLQSKIFWACLLALPFRHKWRNKCLKRGNESGIAGGPKRARFGGAGICWVCRSQWPRGLRRRSATACLLRLWVRIPPGAWTFVCCKCLVLSGRCLCDELITRPEESYRLWCFVVCDLETSWMRWPWPTGGCRTKIKNKLGLLYSNSVWWKGNLKILKIIQRDGI